jgi:hypothetical protein
MRQVDGAYSAPDGYWREGPLSATPPEHPAASWIYGDAERSTWIEGGMKLQLGIPRNPWDDRSASEGSEGTQKSEHSGSSTSESSKLYWSQ